MDDEELEVAEPSLQEQVEEAIGLTDGESAEPDVVEPEVATEAAPEATAEAKVEPKPEPKPTDELYAPLPEHNPRKTHERFAKLVEGHKTVSTERDQVVGERDGLRQKVQEHEQGWKTFQDMGFASEESVADLVQFSQYRNALNSGNFDAAAAVLQEQARQLSLLSGRRIDVNPLAGYPDLNERHQSGGLDEATAMELARARHTQGLQQQYSQRQAQQQEHIATQSGAIHSAAREVDAVVSDLMKDPDYAKVEPELLKQLEGIKTGYPPHMWPREVKRAYDTEARFLRHQAQSQPLPTPLRGNGHSGGLPAPKSMGDAVLQSMGLM
ncbi:hypothetical protein [Methylibium sp.]|uniref:hypothetical protein n=1 Tax=Methylibium sp. TaxID=2067992 RepID=UPI0018319E14|nr:hypothetical protein [Methylibium sp.]MBA3588198.1 hypothetical protein [Methylibium sp.]